MKWSKRTAQGFSPGFGMQNKRALKVARDVSATGGTNTPLSEHNPRSPLSGRFNTLPDPGLKPWAVLLSHFMAESSSACCSHAKLLAINA